MSAKAKYVAQLEALINRIGERPYDALVHEFLRYNEREGAPDELRSLAIDAMLVAEGDTAGEFKTKEQLLEKLQELKDALTA